jgi:hypothetical protein
MERKGEMKDDKRKNKNKFVKKMELEYKREKGKYEERRREWE